jgi:flagellar biosynthesis component FlhA
MEEVEYALARLEAAETPTPGFYEPLVRAALARHSLGDLTRVLRALVDERLSFRDLPGILERLVQFDTVRADSNELVVFDERLPIAEDAPPEAERSWQAQYAYLRRQLSLYLTHTYSWSESDVYVYRLDPELELQASQANGALDEIAVERLRDAVWAQVRRTAPTPIGQVVFTTQGARAGVRELLAPEFPDLPVVADSELTAAADVQTLGAVATAT